MAAKQKNTVLEARARTGSGKGSARKLRAEGLIPAVIYGRHMEAPVHIALVPRAVREAIDTPWGFNTLLDVQIEGGNSAKVLLKTYQVDPVSRDLLHADFIGVAEEEPVKVKVPVTLKGRAAGQVEGGILSQARRELEVLALPNKIPSEIVADVTKLKVNDVLHVSDIELPEGVTIKSRVNFTLATVSAPDGEASPRAQAEAAATTEAPAAEKKK